MARPTKYHAPRARLHAQVDTELYEAVRCYSEESGIPIARLVEDGLRAVLSSRGRSTSKKGAKE